jgi:uncharacterized protein (TIGR02147 family)
MRSFARDLGVSPSRLSDVLNGRYGLSVAAATEIAKCLGLNEDETRSFCDLVEARHARDRRKRHEAQARVALASARYNSLSLDSFQVISEWYHFAILELATTKEFRSSSTWIARQLELNPAVVTGAVARLQRLGLLREDDRGNWFPAERFTASPDGTPSEAVKRFHRQILEKALIAIDCQTVEERDLSSMILAIDPAHIAEAKAEIKKFRRAFDAKFGSSTAKQRVYCLATQFFSLQTKSGELP